jgi:hypothetical protein
MKKQSFIFAALLSLANINSQAQDIVYVSPAAVVSLQNGASLYIKGGMVLSDNSNLSNNGTLTIVRNAAGTADLTDNSTNPYYYGTGKFIFNGAATQNITSANQFERIEMDGNGLNLLSTVNANTWYLKTGKITTGSFIAVATSPLALSVQADITNTNFSNSWINGNLRRFINPAAVNNYQFPVGDAAKVNIAEMDNLIAAPLTGVSYVTASFGAKAGNDAGINVSENGTAYMSVNNGGVWYLVPNANPVSGKYDLKLFFSGFPGLADNSFGILRRPDASAVAIDWIVPTGSVLPAPGSLGRTVAGGYARRNNIATFSQLGIGSTLAPLPLQLLNFYAVKKDKTVVLQWNTANEINTSHFELYKANQPVALQYLDKVTAAGLSTTNTSYSYIDNKPLQGLNFYQLKMVDKNNSYTLSNIVKVNFDDIKPLQVYPNPVTGNTLFVDHNGGKIKAVTLIATDGKQYACNFIAEGPTHLRVSFNEAIAKGDYVLLLNTGDGSQNVKIMIQ